MELWYIIAGFAGALAVAALIEAYLKRNRYRKLSANKPDLRETGNKPLGMEATDLDLVKQVERDNQRHDATNASLVSRFHRHR